MTVIPELTFRAKLSYAIQTPPADTLAFPSKSTQSSITAREKKNFTCSAFITSVDSLTKQDKQDTQ